MLVDEPRVRFLRRMDPIKTNAEEAEQRARLLEAKAKAAAEARAAREAAAREAAARAARAAKHMEKHSLEHADEPRSARDHRRS